MRLRHPATAIALCVPPLLWPALWNGYPLIFSDSGTYISQIVHGWLGWDRPVFYGLLVFLTHWTVSLWPTIIVQCATTAWVLYVLRRVFFPSAWPLLPMVAALSLCSALPWFAAQVMPDLFTGLLTLLLAVLIMAPERLTRAELWVVPCIAAVFTMIHQSHLLLVAALLIMLVPVRGWLGAATPLGWAGLARLAMVPVLAGLAMSSVNLVGHGRFSPSPYGNVFLLARLLYDGPAMDAIENHCPQAGWKLCGYVGQFPEDSDAFLWRGSSPFYAIGGGIPTGQEATSIIVAAVRDEPLREAGVLALNTGRQLSRFASGDGLEPWLTSVRPWIEADFPAYELRAYLASRQARVELGVPDWMQGLHQGLAIAGIAVCLASVLLRRRVSGLHAAVLVAVLANAAITGGLSGPHDRYQSRVMWLPVFVMAMMAPAPAAARRGAALARTAA